MPTGRCEDSMEERERPNAFDMFNQRVGRYKGGHTIAIVIVDREA